MALSLRTSCWSMTNWTSRWEKLRSNMEEVPGVLDSVCVCMRTYVRVRQKLKLSFSAHRGHNGVRSCVDCLQTDVSLIWLGLIDEPEGDFIILAANRRMKYMSYNVDAMEIIYFSFKVGHIELCWCGRQHRLHSLPPVSAAGDEETPSRNRPADRENVGGSSRLGSLLLGREESCGLCSSPERGPAALPAVWATVPAGTKVFVFTSRGQTCSTGNCFSSWRRYCSSELKFLNFEWNVTWMDFWWDFIYFLVKTKVAPHNQEQRLNKVVNYSTDEFQHFLKD